MLLMRQPHSRQPACQLTHLHWIAIQQCKNGFEIPPNSHLLRRVEAAGVNRGRQNGPDSLRVVDEEVGCEVAESLDLLDQFPDSRRIRIGFFQQVVQIAIFTTIVSKKNGPRLEVSMDVPYSSRIRSANSPRCVAVRSR